MADLTKKHYADLLADYEAVKDGDKMWHVRAIKAALKLTLAVMETELAEAAWNDMRERDGLQPNEMTISNEVVTALHQAVDYIQHAQAAQDRRNRAASIGFRWPDKRKGTP